MHTHTAHADLHPNTYSPPQPPLPSHVTYDHILSHTCTSPHALSLVQTHRHTHSRPHAHPPADTLSRPSLILTGTRAPSAPCAVPGQPRPRETAGPLGAASEPAPRLHPHPGAPRTPDRVKGCPMPAGTTAKAPGPEPRIPGSRPTSGAQPPRPAQAPPRTPSQREHLLPWGLTLRGASDGKDAGAVSTSD